MKKFLATSLLIASIFAGSLTSSGLAATANAASVPCTKPTVTSVVQNGNSVNLCFNKVAGATEYKIYCSNSKNGTYKCIGTTNSNNILCKVNGSKKCYYKIQACQKGNNANVKSVVSNIISTCPTR